MKIYHNSRKTEYREPFGAQQVLAPVRLALQLVCEDVSEQILSVEVRLWQDDIGESLVKMDIAGGDFVGDEADGITGRVRYEATLEMPQEPGVLWYFFKIHCHGNDGDYVLYYGNNDEKLGGEGLVKGSEPESYQITVYNYQPVPQWYKDGIVYQIFPDRFARDEDWHDRCQSVIDSEAGRIGQQKTIEEDWYRTAYYGKDEEGNVTSWPFYGGSLKGIEEKLDYLTSLGVSAIYLNPIFEATSNHRYDTADYMKIDPMLGSEDDFRQLAESARAKGIRLILDGVFSHTGADSKYFDKYGNYGGTGAFSNPDSEYRDWYEFRDNDPVGYRSWWGIRDLPEVNETQPGFMELICGEEGVLAKWLRAGASGIRLDVADELPDSFISEIRHRLKKEGEDNLLLGEVWEDASNKISYGERRMYFMGDELDSTMNYPVRDLLLDFALFANRSDDAARRIMSLQENYPSENFYGALNLIGSHDRARIMTVAGADENYDMAADRVKMLSVLQYCLPGIPCIYYGDEAAMTGAADPENRNGFIWERENTAMQFHYRQLGNIYREHPVLQEGALQMLPSGNDDVIAFIRGDDSDDERILVIANRSNETVEISKEVSLKADGDYALELMSSEEIEMSNGKISGPLKVAARSAIIICIRDSKPHSYDMKPGAGVICHISSIPGGKLGAPARDFVDYLVEAGMSMWQVLPLNPPGLGNSPYSSNSAFAGNPEFINYDELPSTQGYNEFYEANRYWLDDYVNYLDSKHKLSDMDKAKVELAQYYFAVQWDELKKYANLNGVKIIGDLPVFVSDDSADVWANRKLFQIGADGTKKCHAGVPPDYFSPEGQDWGNPLYDWEAMKRDGYDWWIKRLDQCRQRYDYVRMDHFRSFSEYYAIPEGRTPADGRWQKGPGEDFFKTVEARLGGHDGVKIIAEDLGQLDSGVYNLLKLSGLPGMNVWQFSCDEMREMTSRQASRRVFYTGTHDNQTLLGWCHDNEMTTSDALAIIREMYESDSPWVMLQLQDLFMLGDEARMNVPGVAEGNWSWQIPGDSVFKGIAHAKEIAAAFKILAIETGRFENPEIRGFMKRHNLYVDDFNRDELLENMRDYFSTQIDDGTIKGIHFDIASGEHRVIAIDMGGTNIRVARMLVGENGINLEKMTRSGMPGRGEVISVNELFDKLATMVMAVDRDGMADSIGFSFSFPAEPTDDGDMIITSWAKELEIIGGQGRSVRQLLSHALDKSGQHERRITVVNDTVATLMSGNIAGKGDEAPCVAGLVIGTGANICILNQTSGLVYNLESGRYPGFPSGDVDKVIDEGSNCRGDFLAEKMICGAYIQTVIASMAEAAVVDGLVSQTMSGPKDKNVLTQIEQGTIRRGAFFAAITIATAIRLSGHRKGACRIMAEGSVFWKMAGMKDNIERYLSLILKDTSIKVEFIRIDDSSLKGAAVLATNTI